MSTPDFTGCLESGFAKAVEAIIATLVPDAATAGTQPSKRPRQVNVLVNASLTPGDLEALKDTIELFGLRPVVIPDLSDSLDGHLPDEDFSPYHRRHAGVRNGNAGRFAGNAGDWRIHECGGGYLAQENGCAGLPFRPFNGVGNQRPVCPYTLHALSAEPVPPKLQRQRAQLQDAMLDTHFMLGLSRRLAADPDLLNAFSQLLAEKTGRTLAAVARRMRRFSSI